MTLTEACDLAREKHKTPRVPYDAAWWEDMNARINEAPDFVLPISLSACQTPQQEDPPAHPLPHANRPADAATASR